MSDTKRPYVPLEQRRAELTRTAVQVMARDGAWALTTRAVAKEAGVPHGSVHYAFSSKTELLRAVIQLDVGHLVEVAEQRHTPCATAEDVRNTVATLFRTYADHVIADPLTETAFFELSFMGVRDDSLREVFAETHRQYRATVADVLSTLADEAGLSWDAPLGLLAEQTTALIFGASSNWLVHRDDALFRAVLDDAATMLSGRLERTPRT